MYIVCIYIMVPDAFCEVFNAKIRGLEPTRTPPAHVGCFLTPRHIWAVPVRSGVTWVKYATKLLKNVSVYVAICPAALFTANGA